MTGRCSILATLCSPGALRCPSSMTRFHYHGLATGPVVHVLTGRAPCAHRHVSQDAAERCTTDPVAPIRLADVAKRRAARMLGAVCQDCPAIVTTGAARCFKCAQRAYYRD